MIRSYSDDQLVDLYDFFQNAPIALQILGPDSVIRFANRADLHIAGYDEQPDRYIGHPLADFHADAGTVEDMIDHWSTGRPLVNFRSELRRPDGTVQRVVIHSNSRLQGGALLGARCFIMGEPAPQAPTEAPSAQLSSEALAGMTEDERSELFDLLDDFFENAPVSLHIVGPDGIVRRANRAELEGLGYADEPERYIGHHIAEFHAEQAVIDDMLERLVGGRPLIHYEAAILHRDGRKLPVVIYSSPRIEGGRFVNTRCFTFPKPADAGNAVRGFGWPRDEERFSTGDEADPVTTTLKRLAGRKHAEESLGFLAEVTRAMESSRDYAEVAAAICHLAVPFLADWSAVELSNGDTACLIATARGAGVTGSDELVRDAVVHGTDRAGAKHTRRLPFATRDGARGALLLVCAGERGGLGAADLALAEETARRVALAIEAGQLLERIEPVLRSA